MLETNTETNTLLFKLKLKFLITLTVEKLFMVQ